MADDPRAVMCLRCGRGTDSLGQLALMTGGSSGVAKLFFGQ